MTTVEKAMTGIGVTNLVEIAIKVDEVYPIQEKDLRTKALTVIEVAVEEEEAEVEGLGMEVITERKVVVVETEEIEDRPNASNVKR